MRVSRRAGAERSRKLTRRLSRRRAQAYADAGADTRTHSNTNSDSFVYADSDAWPDAIARAYAATHA